jgi:predicted amidohydrolase
VIRVPADAMVNRIPIAVADRAGHERGVDWTGGSVIVDADGWPLAMASEGTDATQILLADVDLAASHDKRISARNDVHADRRPWLYQRFRNRPGAASRRVGGSPPAGRGSVGSRAGRRG